MGLFYHRQYRELISSMKMKTKLLIVVIVLFRILFFSNSSISETNNNLIIDGSKVNILSKWEGKYKVKKDIQILILAGHADSQGIAGAGTAGEAVDIKKESPMDPSISDELYWNLKIQTAIVKIGKKKGLNIIAYDPNERNILDGNDPRTNWSVGSNHNKSGGYSLEIHFDSYGEYGYGSGIIPAMTTKLNTIDESLGNRFGRYPIFFRGGLGAPRRGIRILEIAKLEGELEKNLRDQKTRNKTINLIATEIVNALKAGIKNI